MEANFWDHHGIMFLIFITLFPRLTLLFSSVPFGGLFWWIGFFFAPRFLVAVLATLTYVSVNPLLVAISWVVAISGEIGEKRIFRKRIHFVRFRRPGPRNEPPKTQFSNDNVIDAEYKRLDDN